MMVNYSISSLRLYRLYRDKRCCYTSISGW